MKLSDYKIVPGVVIDVADPKFLGRVKADAPGLFNSEVMTKEGMPWIYPFGMAGYQRFSKLINGSKIWIMTDFDNHEFWYWPMFELNQDVRDIISADESDYDESEVLLARNMGDNSVYIYYSPSQGIVLKQGENTSITLTSDNKIITKSGTGQVLIDKGGVYIGDEETDSMEPAVLGNKLVDLLNNMLTAFQTLLQAAPMGYTGNLTPGFQKVVDALSGGPTSPKPVKIKEILATNTKVD